MNENSMQNEPLSASDLSKLFIFALLLLPTNLIFVGIIPSLFVIFGLVMTRRSKDFSHIETAARNLKGYCSLLIVLGLGLAGYVAMTDGAIHSWGDFREGFLIGALVAFIAAIFFALVNTLFLGPLARHRNWVAQHGLFSNKPVIGTSASSSGELDIVRGEKLRTYSVADELLKWAKLKDEGHITDEEFSNARKKLLQRE